MSANERTGWRDQELSERHRLYGYDCPAVDVDLMLNDTPELFDDAFRMIEYYFSRPKAIIEYKHARARSRVIDELLPSTGKMHSNYRACLDLADHYVCEDTKGLPYFVSVYKKNPWMFEVFPVNALARRWVDTDPNWDGRSARMHEPDYVHMLYRMRGKQRAPENVITRLTATYVAHSRAS